MNVVGYILLRPNQTMDFNPVFSPGGYLDPETGMWVAEAKRQSRSSSPERRHYQVGEGRGHIPRLELEILYF